MLFLGTLGTHGDFEVGIVFQDVRLTRKLANIATNGGRAVPSNVLRCGRFRYRIVRDKVNYLLGRSVGAFSQLRTLLGSNPGAWVAKSPSPWG